MILKLARSRSAGRILRDGVWPLLFFLAATVVMTWPLAREVSRSIVARDAFDSNLGAYLIAWDLHALREHPFALFDAPHYYPQRSSLALVEHLVGAAVQAAPIALFSDRPVLWQNALLLAGFALAGWSAFLLARDIGLSHGASLVAGTVYAFLPYHIGQLPRVHLSLYYPAPLYVLFLRRALPRADLGPLAAALGFFLLLSLTSGNYFVFVYPTLILAFGLRLWTARGDGRLFRRLLVRFGVAGLAVAAVLLPFLLPYRSLQAELGHARSIAESVGFSAQLQDFFRLGASGWLRTGTPDLWRRERFVFVGALPLLLAAIGLGGGGRALQMKGERRWIIPATALAALLCLGPFIRAGGVSLFPGPYLVLYHALPGFDGVRVPARFAFLFGLGMALLAGFGVDRILAWLPARAPRGSALAAAYAAALAVAINLHAGAVPLNRVPSPNELPPVYAQLATLPRGTPIAEIPFTTAEADHESKLLLYETAHFLPTVNGFAGYLPEFHARLREQWQAGGLPAVIDDLAAVGVQRLVVHRAEMEPRRLAEVEDLARDGGRIRFQARFGGDDLYAIDALHPLSKPKEDDPK